MMPTTVSHHRWNSANIFGAFSEFWRVPVSISLDPDHTCRSHQGDTQGRSAEVCRDVLGGRGSTKSGSIRSKIVESNDIKDKISVL